MYVWEWGCGDPMSRVDTLNPQRDFCEDVTVASHLRTQSTLGKIKKMVNLLKSLQISPKCMALLRNRGLPWKTRKKRNKWILKQKHCKI